MTPLKRFNTNGKDGKFFSAINAIVDRVNTITPQRTPGQNVNITTQGTAAKPTAKSGPSGGGSSYTPVWL